MKKLMTALLISTFLALPVLSSEYDANEIHPFGQPNYDGHEVLFAFAIGKWKCIGETSNTDGEMVKANLDWEFKYIVNGLAPQDYFDSKAIQGLGMRRVNHQTGKWYLAYHAMFPNYANAMWFGENIEGDIVLDRMVNETTSMRLNFYNIKDKSFEWG